MSNTDVIMVIEDSVDDMTLTIYNLEAAGLRNTIACCANPDEASKYLEAVGSDLPVLILLDLAFPGHMSGIRFLEQLRASPHTRHIPVIVMTASEDDMPATYGLGALAYLVKPVQPNELLRKVHMLGLGVTITA